MTATVEPVAASGVPVPAGRGRWRVTLHWRQFAGNVSWNSLLVGELVGAYGRRLDLQWNQPAQFSFTLDGRSPAAASIAELAQDVIVWRWDEQTGRDVAMFRGPISQAEDQVGDSHAATFTCHDYLAMFQRRLIPGTLTYAQADQDDIVNGLLTAATWPLTSSGVDLRPGSFLPVALALTSPDGTARSAKSGQMRDRTYYGSTIVGDTLADLANVINGFDFDVAPITAANSDSLRIFYPNQGVSRSTPALVFGSTVSTVTRTVSSSDYANYVRTLGNNGASDPSAAQLYSETWNSDATAGSQGSVGLWQTADNAADVSVQSTLDEQAAGVLALQSILVPSYSLGLTPGAYKYGAPNMGDTVPLVVQSGRLNISTVVRVVGISFACNDDAADGEDVTLTVGRPALNLLQILSATGRDVAALTRR